ncbi:hypothetical protein [Caudoviricetes sp.]|nr:hypothetical protein [Caudoviricetes sp.]
MATTPTAADVAAKVAKLRAAAKDTSIPLDIRNQYLDKANALEQSTYKPTMAKGGAVVAKAPAKASAKAPTKSMAKKPASKGAAVAIVIGIGKPKKPMMAKGGMAKKGC